MDNTNIFFLVLKELTTDAFWVWLLYLLDSDVQYAGSKQYLFDTLILKPEDKGRNVRGIKVEKQKKSAHGRIDFLFHFFFGEEDSLNTVMFEDKTWSTTSQGQLEGYKTDYPNLYRYFYYKLAYISDSERDLVIKNGYQIITSKMMTDCLSHFLDKHIIIRYYHDYVKERFTDYIESFQLELFDKCNYDLLWDAQAQLFLCDELWKVLPTKWKNDMYIQNDTSSGRPWTEIVVTEENAIIPGYKESVFWRIDIRRGQFYIRLNQYSSYIDDGQRTIWRKKQERLQILRKLSDSILQDERIHLKKGVPTERGDFEQEIVIFFLPENQWDDIFKDIPTFTDLFLENYYKTLSRLDV